MNILMNNMRRGRRNSNIIVTIIVSLLLQVLSTTSASLHQPILFNLTVAKDGSGDFTRIGDAIAAAPTLSENRYYIGVKSGVYEEYIEIWRNKTFITLVGEDSATTSVVGDRSNKSGYGTAQSATLSICGDGFVAKFLSFKNLAGPDGGQAVAVLNIANNTAFYKCEFWGFQDTLYAGYENHFQFYKDCDIFGTIDFIFGASTSVFQDCRLFPNYPQQVTVTAQSKGSPAAKSIFSFINCTVSAAPELWRNTTGIKVFLGRPWRQYSSVVFMQCLLDEIVDRAGWLKWGTVDVDRVFYAEYGNFGGGANTAGRVKWPGYEVIKDPRIAEEFTVGQLLGGDQWIPQTGVPYYTGLVK